MLRVEERIELNVMLIEQEMDAVRKEYDALCEERKIATPRTEGFVIRDLECLHCELETLQAEMHRYSM